MHQSSAVAGAVWPFFRPGYRHGGCSGRSIAALSISLVSGFLIKHQFAFRLVGGRFLCYLGAQIYRTKPKPAAAAASDVNGLVNAYATTFILTFSNPVTLLSFIAIYAGWHVPSLQGRLFCRGTAGARRPYRFGALVGRFVHWHDGVSREIQSRRARSGCIVFQAH